MSEGNSPIGLNTPDPSGRAPGEILRAAREAQGLSLDQLAATLKVAPTKLAALEEGRIDQLPDASFARALAQTMCRVLKVDPTPVLAGLPAARVAPLVGEKQPLNQPFKETRLAPKLFDGDGDGGWSRLLRPQWAAPIVLLIAAAVIYVLPDSFEWPKLPAMNAPTSAAPPASAPEQTADGNLPVPAASDVIVLDPVVPSASEASLTAPASEVAPPSSSSALAVPESQAVAAPPASSALVSSNSPVPVNDGPVSLVVTEDSWIEVIDGGGNTRLSRIVRAGESMSMGGVAPWRLRVGHARGVKVTLRGQPVDLTPFTRNNVARLELK